MMRQGGGQVSCQAFPSRKHRVQWQESFDRFRAGTYGNPARVDSFIGGKACEK